MPSSTLPSPPDPADSPATDVSRAAQSSAVDSDDRLGRALVRDGLITEDDLAEVLAFQEGAEYRPLGQLLVDRNLITARQLQHVLGRRPAFRLGELLVKSGALSQKQLEHALVQQKVVKEPLGQVLIKLKYLTDEQIRQALSVQLNIQYVELDTMPLDRSLTKIVNGSYARRHSVLPIALTAHTLTVAMDDPTATQLAEDLARSTGRIVKIVTSSHAAMQRAFKRLYGFQTDTAPAPTDGAEILAEEITEKANGGQAGTDQRGDELFRHLLKRAIDERASDVHIEMLPGGLYVRFRMDGVLHEPDLGAMKEAYDRSAREIVSRIKILGGLDIAERRRPQDGSFRVHIEHEGATRPVDLRISIVPSYYGESVVLRVLDRTRVPKTVAQLGLSPRLTEQLRQLIFRPTGILLVTGPTGSGKSTTMYASLLTVYRPQIRILTAEDPIEYVFEQFSQSQVNDQVGNTFAAYLRAFLRHDPEIMMIGEIRDAETAEMALRAAQTGHMLISTLHTNNAVGVVPRLLDLGIDPGLLTSSLNGVVNQRLVRENCPHCKDEYTPSDDILREFFAGPPPAMTFWKGRGCATCAFSGYAGRMIVAELWVPSQHDGILIAKRAHFDEIRASAEYSTISMAEDVKDKLVTGRTNLEELLRMLPYEVIYKLRQNWSGDTTGHTWA